MSLGIAYTHMDIYMQSADNVFSIHQWMCAINLPLAKATVSQVAWPAMIYLPNNEMKDKIIMFKCRRADDVDDDHN